ncbi:MvaI/BcnI restriction endonuclease family protein [Epilithonimonas vandammei]|uniref:MvaI/BcnI restriction endonuclease family protein n=1 Tax=Epilithonimonas vandammei TaxID=2487072 RepID=A0A3G8ZJ30_9FLAO|nr:MvaI/BcnI family restriction endonuclease [Epilithonimonas vandammei]AZI53756.1 MvaI/BcnI restriction endonuclease family protein [Epilithonimonas vandammei]
MNLQNLKKLFIDNGCQKLYVKKLSPNDNSKNQVYLGGSFEILNIFPLSEIKTEEAGDWNRERFKASINFSWIGDDGNIYPAPNSQLILYPKYPEVRFSGFLARCENPPSKLMTQRLADRLLFLSISNKGEILGYVTAPNSELANEFNSLQSDDEIGIFKVIDLPRTVNNRVKLLDELYRIHQLNWITSKRLDRDGNILPCVSSNCGGYTLEAELGITPNGYSEPDFLGWEVKQFGVTNFERINSSVITLMTPEPTDGMYKTQGTEAFLHTYGYPDKTGREDRINFGGVHKAGVRHTSTNLEMQLIGFDQESGKIRNSNGRIALVDIHGNEASAWSFSSMLLHWNRKHNQACYVPSLSETAGERKYKYGNKIILGTGTDFQLFLRQMAVGNIYYDPGIKMENVSTKPKIKKRSQFRIKSQFLGELYKDNEIVTLPTE